MSDEIKVGAFNRPHHLNRGRNLRQDAEEEIDNDHSIREILAVRMKLYANPTIPMKIIRPVDLSGLIKHWKAGNFKQIVTLAGPAISKLSGVPDYWSPDSETRKALVEHHRLPSRSALFELDHILHKPIPFYEFVSSILSGNQLPNVYHYFIRLLFEQGLLMRHYTQDIGLLQRIPGLPSERLVEAHGTFFSNHCVHCRKEHKLTWMWEQLSNCAIPLCQSCRSLVLPDLVFVGQSLPPRFYHMSEEDVISCDLLIVMGTTLENEPFARLFDRVSDSCVRLLMVDLDTDVSHIKGWQEGPTNSRRDVLWRYSCENAIWTLAKELGILEQLEELIEQCTKQGLWIERSSTSMANRCYLKELAATPSGCQVDRVLQHAIWNLIVEELIKKRMDCNNNIKIAQANVNHAKAASAVVSRLKQIKSKLRTTMNK